MTDDPKADMKRYYYPPGTTEPVLRPEFANEPAAAPVPAKADKGEKVIQLGTANKTDKPPAKTTAEVDQKK